MQGAFILWIGSARVYRFDDYPLGWRECRLSLRLFPVVGDQQAQLFPTDTERQGLAFRPVRGVGSQRFLTLRRIELWASGPLGNRKSTASEGVRRDKRALLLPWPSTLGRGLSCPCPPTVCFHKYFCNARRAAGLFPESDWLDR